MTTTLPPNVAATLDRIADPTPTDLAEIGERNLVDCGRVRAG
jgi:hypothetical protein